MQTLRLSHSASALLLGAALLAAPRPAHAQLGGFIKKKIGEAAVNKTVDKVVGEPAREERTPSFSARVLEITPERVDQLLKGLAAEQAEVDRVAKANAANKAKHDAANKEYAAKAEVYKREMAAYLPKQTEWQACAMRQQAAGMSMQADPGTQKAMQAMMAMPPAERERFQARMEQIEKQHEAAEKRGDQAAIAALADSASREYAKATGITVEEQRRTAEAAKKTSASAPNCGMPPVQPTEPQAPEGSDSEQSADAVRAGVKASGIEKDAYTVMRERVTAFISAKGEVSGTGSYIFSKGEREALAARLGDLGRYQQRLEEGERWNFGAG